MSVVHRTAGLNAWNRLTRRLDALTRSPVGIDAADGDPEDVEETREVLADVGPGLLARLEAGIPVRAQPLRALRTPGDGRTATLILALDPDVDGSVRIEINSISVSITVDGITLYMRIEDDQRSSDAAEKLRNTLLDDLAHDAKHSARVYGTKFVRAIVDGATTAAIALLRAALDEEGLVEGSIAIARQDLALRALATAIDAVRPARLHSVTRRAGAHKVDALVVDATRTFSRTVELPLSAGLRHLLPSRAPTTLKATRNPKVFLSFRHQVGRDDVASDPADAVRLLRLHGDGVERLGYAIDDALRGA